MVWLATVETWREGFNPNGFVHFPAEVSGSTKQHVMSMPMYAMYINHIAFNETIEFDCDSFVLVCPARPLLVFLS